jgi:hypothetical protein
LRVIGNRVFPSVVRVQGGTIAVAGLRVTVGGE